jgi:hypothetical protein
MRRIALSAVCLIVCAAAFPMDGQEPTPRAAPWTLTESQIREAVGRVRAGRDLTPASWPDGARVAIGLSFDLDNETGTLRDSGRSPALLSQGEYGSARACRVLAMLDRHYIPASFFVPGVSALLHQARCLPPASQPASSSC